MAGSSCSAAAGGSRRPSTTAAQPFGKSRSRATAAAAIAALVLSGCAPTSRADCMFYQDCNDFPPACIPRMYNETVPAFPLTGPFHPCPQYTTGCCTPDQTAALYISLELLDDAFGEISSGGCPACMANARTFWCAFTCSPNQTDLISALRYANATNVDTQETYTVLQATLRVDVDFACGTYGSCAGTSKVQEDSTLGSMEGFFNFQGNTEAIGHGMQILFEYVSSSAGGGGGNGTNSSSSVSGSAIGGPGPVLPLVSNGGVMLNPNASGVVTGALYSCCNFPQGVGSDGFRTDVALGPDGLALAELPEGWDATANTSCPCSACAGMCAGGECPWGERAGGAGGGGGDNDADAFPNLGVVADDPMFGFPTQTVAGFYGGLGLLCLALIAQFAYRQRVMTTTGKTAGDASSSSSSSSNVRGQGPVPVPRADRRV